jgi:WD40 repeat protein
MLWQNGGAPERACIVFSRRFPASGGQPVRVWDSRTWASLATLSDHSTVVRDLAVDPSDRYLASAGWDGQVALYDTRNWHAIAAWQAHADYARAIAFHPRLPVLASGGGDTTLKLWSVGPEHQLLASADVPGTIEGVAFLPDGNGLIAAVDTGHLHRFKCTFAS